MKRRTFIRYLPTGLLAATATVATSQFSIASAQQNNVLSLEWLGHTCFLFSGDGKRILVNPFRPQGCTDGYPVPNVTADLVLVSSLLLDEGNLEGLSEDQKLLFEPGAYRLGNLQFQGIKTDHDRRGGRRFGTNVVWGWTQAGISILHLGGAAAPISFEQQILMGRPDVLLLPVGGGPKAYNAQEALAALELLNPKMVIPTHYRTQAADASTCEIEAIDEFLTLMSGQEIRQENGNKIQLRPSDLPQQGTVIQVLRSQFS